MNVVVTPKALSGVIPAVPSKSAAHRLLICAALADRPTRLYLSGISEDISATISCLEAMGATIDLSDGICMVTPIDKPTAAPLLDCGESGSTLRFLLPTALAVCGKAVFTGRGLLPQRPIDHLLSALRQNGAAFSDEHIPLTASGRLQSGKYFLPGNISSQYITGLLFTLPLLEGDSSIILTTGMESSGYVNMTIAALRQFGIIAEQTDDGYFVPGGQQYLSSGDIKVEGDWSNAAFFLASGAMGESCTVSGLNLSSGQGDRAVMDILRSFGARVTEHGDSVTVSPDTLHGITIDISEIPDLLPILAVVAACAEGVTHFKNCARLRLKECDRLSAVSNNLRILGAETECGSDWLKVYGGNLKGGCVDSYNDHRMAMSAAIAAIRCTEAVEIRNASAINKSYPNFFEDYIRLGGKLERFYQEGVRHE